MKKKILVVDDEKDIRELLQEFLSGQDFAVITAASGEEALGLIREEEFDLVMCDFRLNGLDGLDVLIRTKDIRPYVPFIVITGFADLRMAVQLMRQGAYDYVTKPISTEEILKTINNALTEAEIQRTVRESTDGKAAEQKNGSDGKPSLKESALKAELEVIQRVLKEVNFNRTKAAKVLGIDRKTLYNKMKAMEG
jgi:two-component system response regulator HydG